MSKKCRSIIYTLAITTIFVIVFALLYVIFHYGIIRPRFELLGDKKVTLALNEHYNERGYEIFYRFHSYHDEVEVSNDIDENKIGTYTITYYVPSLDIRLKREVKVMDKKKPILKLNGSKQVYTFVNNEFKDEGASAYDDYDGDLTSKIKVKSNVDLSKEGNYKIVYSVQDAAGNKQSIKRSVIVKKDPTKVKLSYNYDDYNNTAMQWWFTKSKTHQREKGALDAKLLKKYDAYYIGEDEKVLYLTFDEGGSDKTYIKQIAHLLDRYEIQGTFFLTRNYILSEPDFIRDLAAHGHVVGNHTRNHLNMSTLANGKEVDKFTDEITSVEKAYMQVTGQEMIKVFRFPKGEESERSMKMLQDLGYRTYFWSHAYYDFAGQLSYDTAYRYMADYYHDGAIYLMHPNNKGNYDALEDFIKLMLEKGYHFKTVDQIK